jgi:hypothetical protein
MKQKQLSFRCTLLDICQVDASADDWLCPKCGVFFSLVLVLVVTWSLPLDLFTFAHIYGLFLS